jgi:NAD(P)-dependent dehydrogenase (short-subunit alcohol dehydrogenase family)
VTVFAGKVAVVTGASGGMGRSLAVQLARAGAKLAICDIDPVGLAETARMCGEQGAEVKTDLLDVAERARVLDYADGVVARFGTVNYVFNNAGISFVGSVERSKFKDMERVMDVDFWGTVNCTKAFLPHLLASSDGHVVNISSMLGLFAMPDQSAYSAAKFAVRGFSEALRMEMIAGGHPLRVSCVHPGAVKTGILRNGAAAEGLDLATMSAAFERVARTTADSAAGTILDGVAKGKPRIIVGADARVLDLVVRLVGSRYQQLFTWSARRSNAGRPLRPRPRSHVGPVRPH